MCSEGNCCCLKLETGTLVFGVITSVFNALGLLAIIAGIIAFNVMAFDQSSTPSASYDIAGNRFSYSYTPHRNSYGIPPEAVAGANVGLVFGLLKGIMDFTFSVLLCTGVTKRRPSHLKAYFIYGIVMAVLVSLAVLVVSIVFQSLVAGLIGTLGIVLYGLILHMINLTHQKLSLPAGEVYGFEHKRLQETVS